ncbi:hypothetical protein [Myroides odoratus]|uniref:hypothetical protein n=1 Tax=Myroides odoratus TaxID=256 RepID=UPI0039B06CF6
MKKIVFFAFLLGAGFVAKAQVGIGTPTPIDSAMLDIEANDKGILIPRVSLTSATVFSPIDGTEIESLLVFNAGTVLKKGFYFWKDSKWNQIIDEIGLKDAISDALGGENLDLGEIKKIVDFLVPTNPQSSDKSVSQAALIIDPVDNKIYSVNYNETTATYERKPVDLQEGVKEAETRTFFKKALITEDGQAPAFELTNAEPNFTASKKGEIYYQYLGEDNRIDYLNLSADVTNIIENNESIKQEITNILNQGGNVYFTQVAIDNIPANSVYFVDTETNEKKQIDLTPSIINSITENTEIKEIIKNEAGNKITTDTVIKTGNQIDGDAVYIYKTTTKIKGAKANKVQLDGKLHEGARHIDRILNLQVFKGKQLITNAVTDVVIDVTQTRFDFNLGNGKMYVPVVEGDYEIIVEFTAK